MSEQFDFLTDGLTIPDVTDVSIDIETLDTKDDAIILSIAMVPFNRDANRIFVKDTFVAYPDIDSQFERVRTMSASTFKFWLGNNVTPEARMDIVNKDMDDAMSVINGMIQFVDKYSDCRFWGNGPTFDIDILESYFNTFSDYILSTVSKPAQEELFNKFWNIRDIRTIKDVAKALNLTIGFENGVAHTAKDDAIYQARLVCETFKILNALVKH